MRNTSRGLFILALIVSMYLLASCSPSGATPEAESCLSVLVVNTTPDGALVTIDGEARGEAPVRVELSGDTASLQVEYDGFATYRRTVRLTCGEKTTMNVVLEDIRPPQVWLDIPTGQVSPDAGLKLSAEAWDSGGIAQIALFVDGEQTAVLNEPTLRHNVDTRGLAPGVHEVEARAWDNAGLEGLAKGAFVVANPTATPQPSATPTAMATPRPTWTPTAEAEPGTTPTAEPVTNVSVSRRTIDIPTYGYRAALYTDPARVGHPYPLLGQGWGTVSTETYELIVLRNEYLEIELLPELGGRIYQVRYLPTDQPLLYNNSVIKPTNWGPADQGWWLSVGGIEFCLPVDEHGYLTAEPWDATVAELDDGSATVTMSILEQTRQVAAEVTITLRPGEASFDIGSRLTSQSDEPESLQYWINAQLSPGQHSVGDGLRFVLPGDQAVLHSTGMTGMPAEYETFSWPEYNGRDLSDYGAWDSYLGFFMPNRTADFAAVYDEDTQIGIVRVFPGSVADGLKVFGFGRKFETNIYTDDGSQYIELWGGWTPTFRDTATLAPGASIYWRETWYPITSMPGPSLANSEIALWAEHDGDRLTVHAHGTHEEQVQLVVMQGSEEVSRQSMPLSPTRPLHTEVGLRGNLAADIHVLILRPTGQVIIEETIASSGG